VKADGVDELFTYVQYSVQRHEVNLSTIFNGLPSLTILLISPCYGAMSGTENMLNFEYSIPKKKKKIGGNFHQKVLKVRK
jgi:hypothetical protein